MPREENDMEALRLQTYHRKAQVDVGNVFQKNVERHRAVHLKCITSSLCDMDLNKAVKSI